MFTTMIAFKQSFQITKKIDLGVKGQLRSQILKTCLRSS